MRVSFLAALFSCLLPMAAVADQSEAALMAQAQRAYLSGDYDTAKDLFGQVTDMDPHNMLAIQYLRNIRLKEAKAGGATPAQDPVQGLTLQKIAFKDATFSAALDYFKQEAAKSSVNVSFVSELPEPQMSHKVTLNLSNIPFLDALKYLCDLDGATYKQERYAIVIAPAAAPDSTSEASPAPGQ
jgi:hypothetical protein